MSREPSPDGRLTAIMFTDHCGANGDFSTQVVIERPNEAPGKGHVFRLEGTTRPTVFPHGGSRAPWANIEWLAEDALLIRYDGSHRVVTKESRVSGVKISYLATGS